jgi:type IV pilus assembly protein PilM
LAVLGKKNIVGLDIGSDSIKAVRLKGLKQNEISVITRLKLSCENHDDALFESVSEKGLKSLAKSMGLSQSPSASVIYDPSISFVNVHLPPMPTGEIIEAVKFEAKKELTYPISEAVVDYFIKDKPTTEKTEYSLTAVSVKKEAVYKHINFLKRAGFKAAAVETEAIPLMAAFDFNHSWDPGKKTAILDIGTAESHLLIVRDRSIRFYRDIPVSGNSFTRFFQETYNLSYTEAEEKKVDLIGREHSGKKNFSDIEGGEKIPILIEELAVELQRSFDYYQARYREGPINELILSGGGALILDIDRYLRDILGIEVTIDNPFKKLYFANKKDEEEYSKIAPIFTLAVGLALRKK